MDVFESEESFAESHIMLATIVYGDVERFSESWRTIHSDPSAVSYDVLAESFPEFALG